jgi:hypothetical protein
LPGPVNDDKVCSTMIEVFKSNVRDPGQAKKLVELIHQTFQGYEANFDLEDCDKVLRVKSRSDRVKPTVLIELLKRRGFYAEVMMD